VRDIEALRTRLMIERWLVFGGSSGSTLALASQFPFVDGWSILVERAAAAEA
jgi:pimeloyl-ACP methyl ester carboxylesterase